LRIAGMAMLIGKPGATAAELFTAAKARNYAARLRSSPFDAVCLSAGGNDQLSERLAKIFAAWMPPHAQPKIGARDAFDILLESGSLDGVRNRYATVLDAFGAVQGIRPHFRVLGHTYAPIQRIGVPADLTLANIGLVAWLKGDVGPWLWRVMQHVVEDASQARAFARLLMLDGFRDRVLKPLASPGQYGGLFSYTDFTEVPEAAADAFWHDEIHPTEAGFAVLARAMNQDLRKLMPVEKQWAIS
jgi:lysophospholipase L1-like esterase